MPRSHKGHKFILCTIDGVTNYLITVPIYQGRSEEIGEAHSNPDIKVSGTFREYYEFLKKRTKYLQNILFNFKPKRLAMINKDRAFLQYKSRDLVYIISPLTSQLCTASQKVTIKYIGPVVIYEIIDPHNYLLMTLDGRILRGLFKHERLKLTGIRMSQGNVQNLAQLKQIMNAGLRFE